MPSLGEPHYAPGGRAMSAAMLRGPKLSSSMSLHHIPSSSSSYVNLNAESAEATISKLSKSVVGYHFCQEKLELMPSSNIFIKFLLTSFTN